MSLMHIDIKPGSMASDVVENELGTHRHQLVTNLRQKKKGEWENPKGYINVVEPGSNIKIAEEFTDDLSGDRFILFQDGTNLKRLDYDSGDGNGYENEVLSTLTLPTGITMGSGTTCRFFYYRGVVRITGPENASGAGVPLWYGYIDRTIFPDAWKEIDLSAFESDTDGWTGNDATLSQYDCDADGDGAGMWGAPEKVNALKVIQTANTGAARQSFSVTSGKVCRVLAMVFRASGGTGDIQVKIGSSAGASDYETLSSSTEDEWAILESAEFELTGSTLHVDLIPSAGAANDTAYFDFILIEESAKIVIQEWVMEKAEVDSLEVDVYGITAINYNIGATSYSRFAGSFGKVDKGQFSLPVEATVSDDAIDPRTVLDNELSFGAYNFLSIDIKVGGANALTSFQNKRISNVGINIASSPLTDPLIDPDDAVWYVSHDIDITEDLGNVKATRTRLWYDNAHKNRFYFDHDAASTDDKSDLVDHYLVVGQRCTLVDYDIASVSQSFDVIITEVTDTYFEISIPIYPHFKAADTDGYFDYIGFDLIRKWVYDDTNGYKTRLGLNFAGLANEYYAYADIPAETEDLNPDYSHWMVANKKAYCLSLEDEEEDILRHSPINQFDIFPNGQIITNDVGGRDSNVALINRDDKITALKKKAISQYHFVASDYSQDIAFAKHGLYATKGYMVLIRTLYFMDSDDVYLFSGASDPIPLMTASELKLTYQENVSVNSFMVYNKEDREIIFVLNNYILVFHNINPAKDEWEWYKKETDITPLGGYLDDDNNLILYNATKLVQINHSETTFDEAVNYNFTTSIQDLDTPEFYKKLGYLEIFGESSEDISVEVRDANQTSPVLDNFDITLPAAEPETPDKLFKELEVVVSGKAASTTMLTKIRNLRLGINKWR